MGWHLPRSWLVRLYLADARQRKRMLAEPLRWVLAFLLLAFLVYAPRIWALITGVLS